MSTSVRWGDLGAPGTDISGTVRRPGGAAVPWVLSEGGEKAAMAQSGFNSEDPAAALSLVGLKELHFEESAGSDPTLFAGFLDTRDIQRATERALRAGAQREWDVATTDLNVLLSDYIIDSGKRPAETDIARITWLLASGYCPIGVTSFIDSASPTSLPAADYTGRTALDVISEASNLSNKNFLVRWEQNCTWPDPTSPWAAAFVSTYVPPAAHPILSSADVLGGYYASWTVGCVSSEYGPASSVYPCTTVGNTLGSVNSGCSFGVDNFAGWGPVSVLASYTFDLLAAGLPAIATVGLINWYVPFPHSSPTLNDYTLIVEASNDGTTWTTVWDTDTVIAGSGSGVGGTFIGTVPTALTQSRYWRVTHTAGWSADHANFWEFFIDGIMLWAGDATGPGPALIYHAYNWASDASTLAISNVLGDVDNVVTFTPAESDKLTRDPARVFSGIFFEYSGGHVTASNPATLADFRHRDTRSSDLNCTSPAAAAALANAYLTRCNTEEDRIIVHLHEVPAGSVNGARPGQRIPIRLSHSPGYESGTYMGIMKRSIAPAARGKFDVTLELAVPVLTGLKPSQFLNPSLPINIGTVTQPIPVGSGGSGVTGQPIIPTFIAYGDGATRAFSVGSGYLPGSLRVWVDAQPIPSSEITETNPATGAFTLDFAPAAASSSAPAETLTASWQIGGSVGGPVDTSTMPTASISGWDIAFTDDFDTWDDTRYRVYPTSYHDTTGHGQYTPDIISADGGNLNISIQTIAGVHAVAAFIPLVPGFTEGNLPSMRYSFRIRADSMPNYKGVPLLWPESESSTDGEIDGPESDFTDTPQSFVHHQGGGSQDAYSAPSGTSWQDWHTYTIEWIAGVSVTTYIDGVLWYTDTSSIPENPMHLVMQFETSTSGAMPSDSTSGLVQIAWLAVWTAA